MKRIATLFLTLLGFVMFPSCQSKSGVEEDLENLTSLVDVTFSASMPKGEFLTRGALLGEESNSALGGLYNLDLVNQYDLRYQIAIYKLEDNGTYRRVVSPTQKIEDLNKPVVFSLRLNPNRTYKAVLWADFIPQGTREDYHYNTQDFTNITLLHSDATATLNDESRDAFCAVQEFSVTTNQVAQALVLKRPFAKLRLVATDWDPTAPKVDQLRVSYYGCKRFTGINLLTNEVKSVEIPKEENVTVYKGVVHKTQKEYALGYDLSPSNRTLVVDYLMAPPEGQTPINIIFEALEGNTSLVRYNLKSNIPIQRNWLTTITGNLLTNTGGAVVLSRKLSPQLSFSPIH